MNLRRREYLVESKKLSVKTVIPDSELGDTELIQRIKSYGVDRSKGWSLFVTARSLRPGIDAKDFYQIFDSVGPNAHTKQTTVDFDPTHKDENGTEIMVISRSPTVVKYVLGYGGIGSSPSSHFDQAYKPVK